MSAGQPTSELQHDDVLELAPLLRRVIASYPDAARRVNGPYVIESEDVKVVDWNGASYEIVKRPFALCRCGGSTTKPFCDKTHSKIGFEAAERALAGEDAPDDLDVLPGAGATAREGGVPQHSLISLDQQGG